MAELCVDESAGLTNGPAQLTLNWLVLSSRSLAQMLSAQDLITVVYRSFGDACCNINKLRMKIPLNWVALGSQSSGSQESWMTWLESARALMAAWAMVLAEPIYDWLGEALLSSTRPPRTTPWLYDQLHDLSVNQAITPPLNRVEVITYVVCPLFVHESVSPSLIVLFELIIPLVANQSHSFCAQST